MTTLALLNVTTYLDGHDFTTDSNQALLTTEAAALDATTFGSNGWTELKGGLKTSTLNMQGFWQSAASDAVDPEAFTNLGVRNRVHTLAATGTEAEPAYLWRAGHFSYQLGGTLGEMAPFTLGSQGTDGVGVVRGHLAAAKQNVSAVGAFGSGVNLGAGSAGEFLYATLHAFVAGTTVTVEIQSDADNTFAAPTVVATFPAVTAVGGSWLARVDASAITDTWFRFNVPTAGITGTFSLAGAIAIQ